MRKGNTSYVVLLVFLTAFVCMYALYSFATASSDVSLPLDSHLAVQHVTLLSLQEEDALFFSLRDAHIATYRSVVSSPNTIASFSQGVLTDEVARSLSLSRDQFTSSEEIVTVEVKRPLSSPLLAEGSQVNVTFYPRYRVSSNLSEWGLPTISSLQDLISDCRGEDDAPTCYDEALSGYVEQSALRTDTSVTFRSSQLFSDSGQGTPIELVLPIDPSP